MYCFGIFSNTLDLKPETSFYYNSMIKRMDKSNYFILKRKGENHSGEQMEEREREGREKASRVCEVDCCTKRG